MTAAPAVKGWCPTLLAPMQSGDGWLARVKPSAGVITAAAARVIAQAASRHGNGHIDLTSRGNLQVRGLSPRSAELFAETILATGLASADPAVEAIRNVMASPLGPDDPSAAFDSHALAREIEAMLAAEPALQALAGKVLRSRRWRRRAAACRHHRRHHGARPWRCSRRAARWRHARGACRARARSPRRSRPWRSPSCVCRGTGASRRAAWRRSWPRSARLRSLPPRVLSQSPMRDGSSAAPRAPIGFVPIPAPAAGCFGVGSAVRPHRGRRADRRSPSFPSAMATARLRTTPWRALLLPGIAETDAATLDARGRSARPHRRCRRPAPRHLRLRRRAGLPQRQRRCARRCRPPCRRRSAASKGRSHPCLRLRQVLRPSRGRGADPRRPRRALRPDPRRRHDREAGARRPRHRPRSSPCFSLSRVSHERRLRLFPRRRRDLSPLLRHHPRRGGSRPLQPRRGARRRPRHPCLRHGRDRPRP